MRARGSRSGMYVLGLVTVTSCSGEASTATTSASSLEASVSAVASASSAPAFSARALPSHPRWEEVVDATKPLAPYTGPKMRRVGEGWAIGDDGRAYARQSLFGEANAGDLHLVPGLSGVEELYLGRLVFCARFSDRIIRCWGDNSDHGLGDLPGCSHSFEKPSDPDRYLERIVRITCKLPREVPWARGATFVDPGEASTCFALGTVLRCAGFQDENIHVGTCPIKSLSGLSARMCPATSLDLGHRIARTDQLRVLTEDGLLGEVKQRKLEVEHRNVRDTANDEATILFTDGTVRTNGRLLLLRDVKQITGAYAWWCRRARGDIVPHGGDCDTMPSEVYDTCGLTLDGRVLCVDGVFGEQPVEIKGLGKVVQLAYGMALNDAGAVYRLAGGQPPSGPRPLEIR